MRQEYPMLENILSLGRLETWQASLALAERSINLWLEKVGRLDYEQVVFTGCGTSLYNGQVAKHAMEALAGIRAEAVPAFSFSRYAKPRVLGAKTLVVGISTTGKTQSACEALARAQEAGAHTLAVTAFPGSPVTRLAEGTLLTGGEKDNMSVKTSSYVQALITLYLLAIRLGETEAGNSTKRAEKLPASQLELRKVIPHPGVRVRTPPSPDGRGVKPKVDIDWRGQILKAGEGAKLFLERGRGEIQYLAEQFTGASRVFVLGAGANQGTAEEAALKVIEMAKLPAEAQELEDFFHGRLREVDRTTPMFFIAPKGAASGRVLDFLTVMDHIQAPAIALTNEVSEGIRTLATHVIQMPGGVDMPGGLEELFTPLLYIVPLHLFGYELALARGFDPNARRYNIVPQKVRYGEKVEEL